MPRAKTICTKCKRPKHGKVCEHCGHGRHHGPHHQTPAERGLDQAWRVLVDQAKRAQPWCAWPSGCRRPITELNPLTGDHDEPRSRAPHRVHDPTNIIVLCQWHNSRKGTRTMAEVRRDLARR